MFSLSWYLVGGLVALGVGILIGFEISDKSKQKTIEHLKDIHQRNVNTLTDLIQTLTKEGEPNGQNIKE
jgi:uncharacterized protein YneF (UPF0154 family)